jgi:hypothetical protein
MLTGIDDIDPESIKLLGASVQRNPPAFHPAGIRLANPAIVTAPMRPVSQGHIEPDQNDFPGSELDGQIDGLKPGVSAAGLETAPKDTRLPSQDFGPRLQPDLPQPVNPRCSRRWSYL